jgi:choline kinase
VTTTTPARALILVAGTGTRLGAPREEVIRQAVGDQLDGMRIRYRVNDRFDSTGTTHSLKTALQNVDEDTLVLEGDDESDLRRAEAMFTGATHGSR